MQSPRAGTAVDLCTGPLAASGLADLAHVASLASVSRGHHPPRPFNHGISLLGRGHSADSSGGGQLWQISALWGASPTPQWRSSLRCFKRPLLALNTADQAIRLGCQPTSSGLREVSSSAVDDRRCQYMPSVRSIFKVLPRSFSSLPLLRFSALSMGLSRWASPRPPPVIEWLNVAH